MVWCCCGLIVAIVNRYREEPLDPWKILKWVAIACVVLWVLMMFVLVAVYLIAGNIAVEDRKPTFEQDRRLVAVAMAHNTEYVLGAIALLVVSIKTWRHGR